MGFILGVKTVDVSFSHCECSDVAIALAVRE